MKSRMVILSLLLITACPADAMNVGGIDLPKHRDALQLQGAGLLRKGFIFKIYVGALYLESGDDAGSILGPVPKRIDIHYFHHTPKEQMIRVAEQTLKKNVPADDLNALRPKIDQLHDAFLNGAKGSVASIVFNPGEGLTYSFDDETVVIIPCDDFANAYFRIWLGEHPSSKSVKKAMLGGEAVGNE
jgi:hypothetical protein